MVESLLNVSHIYDLLIIHGCNKFFKANSKLASKKDEDERLPIHWAVSYNHLPIVELLVSQKSFDAEVQVRSTILLS